MEYTLKDIIKLIYNKFSTNPFVHLIEYKSKSAFGRYDMYYIDVEGFKRIEANTEDGVLIKAYNYFNDYKVTPDICRHNGDWYYDEGFEDELIRDNCIRYNYYCRHCGQKFVHTEKHILHKLNPTKYEDECGLTGRGGYTGFTGSTGRTVPIAPLGAIKEIKIDKENNKHNLIINKQDYKEALNKLEIEINKKISKNHIINDTKYNYDYWLSLKTRGHTLYGGDYNYTLDITISFNIDDILSRITYEFFGKNKEIVVNKAIKYFKKMKSKLSIEKYKR